MALAISERFGRAVGADRLTSACRSIVLRDGIWRGKAIAVPIPAANKAVFIGPTSLTARDWRRSLRRIVGSRD